MSYDLSDNVRPEVIWAITDTWNLPEVYSYGDDPRRSDGSRLDHSDRELLRDATLAELQAALDALNSRVRNELARRDWFAEYLCDRIAGHR